MKNKKLACALLLIALLIGIMPLISCDIFDTDARLTIKNDTDVALSILVFMGSPTSKPYEVGYLNPDQSKKYRFDHDAWYVTRAVWIAALDSEGYLAYYRTYSRDEIKELNEKIAIADKPEWHQTPYWNELWGDPLWKTKTLP